MLTTKTASVAPAKRLKAEDKGARFIARKLLPIGLGETEERLREADDEGKPKAAL